MTEISSSETASSEIQNGVGPYFFAWVDEGTAFDPNLHARSNEDIFEFTLDQQEGDFASLDITIKNPRIGLLAPGRQIWAWFSWWNGTQAVPLFFGRLVGLPTNLEAETVQLNFIARPPDFTNQKEQVADTLRVTPFWDGIWFSAATRYDPDNVLESRPEAWHIDRTSLVVTTSNIIDGEDGSLEFDEDQVFYQTVNISYDTNPLRAVTVTATVSWAQAGTGAIPFPLGVDIQPGRLIQSYTGGGLAAGWPKPGDSAGGGWTYGPNTQAVATGTLDSSLVGQIAFDPLNNGLSFYVDGGFDTSLGSVGSLPGGQNVGLSYHVAIPNITVSWSMSLTWTANRQKTEVLTFTLGADVQDILTLPDDGEALALTFSSSELTTAVDPVDGSAAHSCAAEYGIPLASPLARSYFNTDRGAQSIYYLVAVARANLLARARCVKIDFEIPFELAIASGITLRKNAVIIDERLPGGTAGGKIFAYSLSLANGQQHAKITIAATVGRNGTEEQITGTPDYCDTDYVDSPYQTFSGAYNIPFDETDVAVQDISNVPPNDDGVDFLRFSSNTIKAFRLLNPNGDHETQVDALQRFEVITNADLTLTFQCIRYAQVTFKVPDLTGGPFQTDYTPDMTQLKIPRTINLEAPSEGVSS